MAFAFVGGGGGANYCRIFFNDFIPHGKFSHGNLRAIRVPKIWIRFDKLDLSGRPGGGTRNQRTLEVNRSHSVRSGRSVGLRIKAKYVGSRKLSGSWSNSAEPPEAVRLFSASLRFSADCEVPTPK